MTITSSTSANKNLHAKGTQQTHWISRSAIRFKWDHKIEDAKNRNIQFDISSKEWSNLWKTSDGYCDYTGVKMTLETGMDNSASLDRINPYGDYIISNLCICTVQSNSLKNNLLELKINSNIKPTISDKKLLEKICSIIYNPIKLKELQEKYIIKDIKPEDVISGVENTPESQGEAVREVLLSNPDIDLSLKYNRLGVLIESVSEFPLTFVQYKAKMKSNKCNLTKRKFTKDDEKCLYWVDKNKPFSYSNCLLTSVSIQTALDIFTATSKLTLTELKSLCKVLSLHETK